MVAELEGTAAPEHEAPLVAAAHVQVKAMATLDSSGSWLEEPSMVIED